MFGAGHLRCRSTLRLREAGFGLLLCEPVGVGLHVNFVIYLACCLLVFFLKTVRNCFGLAFGLALSETTTSLHSSSWLDNTTGSTWSEDLQLNTSDFCRKSRPI